MVLKKQNFAEGEITIFDEACVYKRGEYWQFRLWLPKENKWTNEQKNVYNLTRFSSYSVRVQIA